MKRIPVCPNCHTPIEEDNLRAEVNAVGVYDVFYREGEGLSYDSIDYYENFDEVRFYCKNCDELLPYGEKEIEKILKQVKSNKRENGEG
jgi:hypothetical protein